MKVGRQVEPPEQKEFWRQVEISAREVEQWPSWLWGVDESEKKKENYDKGESIQGI